MMRCKLEDPKMMYFVTTLFSRNYYSHLLYLIGQASGRTHLRLLVFSGVLFLFTPRKGRLNRLTMLRCSVFTECLKNAEIKIQMSTSLAHSRAKMRKIDRTI